jgi:hypothetical protein
VHGSGRSSPNSDGGEAVCGGGVDVTCSKEMDGTQFEFGNGGGLPPELRCPARRRDFLARDSFPAPSFAPVALNRAHTLRLRASLVSSEEIAADEAGEAGEPRSRPGQEGLAADLRRPTQIKTARNSIAIRDYIKII